MEKWSLAKLRWCLNYLPPLLFFFSLVITKIRIIYLHLQICINWSILLGSFVHLFWLCVDCSSIFLAGLNFAYYHFYFRFIYYHLYFKVGHFYLPQVIS